MKNTSRLDQELERLRKLFVEEGVLSVADERCRGFSRYCLKKLLEEGFLTRVSRGVYSHAGVKARESMNYEEIAKVRADAVLCLTTALRIHGLTEENPHRIHVAIPQKARFPKGLTAVQLHRFSPKAWSLGVEERQGGYGPYRVYSVEKTLVDCFKFRSVVGLDVAIAALREAVSKRLVNWDCLWQAMGVCRMTKVMRPYLESFS